MQLHETECHLIASMNCNANPFLLFKQAVIEARIGLKSFFNGYRSYSIVMAKCNKCKHWSSSSVSPLVLRAVMVGLHSGIFSVRKAHVELSHSKTGFRSGPTFYFGASVSKIQDQS